MDVKVKGRILLSILVFIYIYVMINLIIQPFIISDYLISVFFVDPWKLVFFINYIFVFFICSIICYIGIILLNSLILLSRTILTINKSFFKSNGNF
ncbi:hypothetical protein PFMC_03466 [Plasmodium falciparum CAMP/Malaysia]|uniref:Uncharacterized protein n=1 Tax=Plasmodium falciparum (isolate Camp / Malaysia) TaxID=5835 RepID=A0A024X7J2_PLAFC|nr:hypothetical protein PFMC_03466 [Plasmodium falciparum CAMP/Malaysia]